MDETVTVIIDILEFLCVVAAIMILYFLIVFCWCAFKDAIQRLKDWCHRNTEESEVDSRSGWNDDHGLQSRIRVSGDIVIAITMTYECV